jgi:hypothetical protein
VNIWVDESGGVGRGVMTLAAVALATEAADAIITQFRAATGIAGEVKGSRINLAERAQLLDLFAQAHGHAVVAIATRALAPDPGNDRGQHDRIIYAQLLDDAVADLMLASGGCAQVVIDDGRYSPATLAGIRQEIAALVGPCGSAKLELSHRASGLQIADVIANSFFNRALPGQRQGRFAAMLEPLMESRRIRMRVLKDG